MAGKNNALKIKSILACLGSYRKAIAAISVFTIVLSVLQVTLALVSRYVVDAAMGVQGNFAFWCLALAANIFALIGIHSLLSWYSGKATDVFTANMRQKLLRTAVYGRDEALLGRHSGELLNRGMEDVHTVCDGAVNLLPNLLGQVTRLVVTFAAMVTLSASVASILLVGALVVGALVACVRPAIKKHQRAVRETDDKVMSTMQESLQQLELVQSLSMQEQVLGRFHKKVQNSLLARFYRRLWSVGSNGLINAASQISGGALLLWGASRVAAGALSYGTLTSMLQLLSLFRGPVLGLSGLWTRLASVEVAADRLKELLLPVTPAEKLPDTPKVAAVVFDNVTFSYPGEGAPVLENFSYRFSLDGWTCMSGASGRGKTTMFKLILGLYKPQQGEVYLETDQGKLMCSEATRDLFAYVPQDYALFSGTILENMQLVAPDVAEEQMKAAFSVAQADFVWQLSEGVQTQVQENNSGLSKGQIQRLAVARAVLMQRPILLLDECTSALDAGTEDALLRNLHDTAKCALVVTHRPEALDVLKDITLVSIEK